VFFALVAERSLIAFAGLPGFAGHEVTGALWTGIGGITCQSCQSRKQAEHVGVERDGIRIRCRRLDSFLEASRRSYR
jgi:hypothetical protein